MGFQCPECASDRPTKVVRAGGLNVFRPVVTIALIGINVAVWVIGQLVWRPDNLMDTASKAMTHGGLIASGVQVSGPPYHVAGMVGVAQGDWYRIITSGFMHVSIFHLGINMWALWVLGQVTERALGRYQTVVLYMIALVSGSFGALLVSPFSLTVGASGAIFGLMGGLLVVAQARGIAMRETGLLGVLGINLVLTFTLSGSLSVGGHIGGLIGGALAAFIIVTIPAKFRSLHGPSKTMYQAVVPALVFVAIIVGAIAVANANANGDPGPGLVASQTTVPASEQPPGVSNRSGG